MLRIISKELLLVAVRRWSSVASSTRRCSGRSARPCSPSRRTAAWCKGPDGAVVGSLLIAQPFTKDEYFQPRPSACSYDASASASSALAASNYALRDRVARDARADRRHTAAAQGRPSRWRPTSRRGSRRTSARATRISSRNGPTLHNGLAQAWVERATPRPRRLRRRLDRRSTTPSWPSSIKDNPATPQPKAVRPGGRVLRGRSPARIPGGSPRRSPGHGADGKPVTTIEPVKDGSDIQSIFFDMWRQEHAG